VGGAGAACVALDEDLPDHVATMFSRVSFTVAVLLAVGIALAPMKSLGKMARIGAILAMLGGAGLLYILLHPFDLGPYRWGGVAEALAAGTFTLWMGAFALRLAEAQAKPNDLMTGIFCLAWCPWLVGFRFFPDSSTWVPLAVLLVVIVVAMAVWRRWIPAVAAIALAAAFLVWGMWQSGLRTTEEIYRHPVPCSRDRGRGCMEWTAGLGQEYDLVVSCRNAGGIATTLKPGTIECLVQR
jgi:hypothetical protein